MNNQRNDPPRARTPIGSLVRYALIGSGVAMVTIAVAFFVESNEQGSRPQWASMRVALFALLGGGIAGATLWMRKALDARGIGAHYLFWVLAMTFGAIPGMLDDALRRGDVSVLWYAPAFGVVVGLSLAAGMHYLNSPS